MRVRRIVHDLKRFGGVEAADLGVVEEGRGAIVRVALPAATTADAPKVAGVAPASARRGRVLLVDDEPSIGQALTRLLKRDHDVAFVSDARTALTRIVAGETFDIVLCDLMMPDMNGMELFEAVCAQKPEVARRIVFLSGGAFSAKTQAFLHATTNVALTKPVDVDALRRVVADYVADAPSAPGK
jgi:CheY-like chemotaxis protein